jgi:hypothetical protein
MSRHTEKNVNLYNKARDDLSEKVGTYLMHPHTEQGGVTAQKNAASHAKTVAQAADRQSLNTSLQPDAVGSVPLALVNEDPSAVTNKCMDRAPQGGNCSVEVVASGSDPLQAAPLHSGVGNSFDPRSM